MGSSGRTGGSAKVGATPTDLEQMEEGLAFQDFQDFREHGAVKKNELFDEQFLHFIKWFKEDLRGRYTVDDYRRMERADLLILLGGFCGVFVAYLVGFHFYRDQALVWGIPLFVASLALATRAEVFHMRTHCPRNLTGWPRLDAFVDTFGLALSGVSPNLFKRRHLAAHFNDVGAVSKLFSNVWLVFTQVPLSYYLRPDKLIGFLRDDAFCKRELINQGRLRWEALFFFLYLAALVTELAMGSWFLLCFQLAPGLIISGAQIMGAFIVHSGKDAINSWESNGLMDHKTADGLFKVTLGWFRLFNNNLFVNHAIHHANPQVPLRIINQDYERYHRFILSTYEGVRYNRLIFHDVYEPILKRMPAPGPLAYGVAFFVVLFSHGMITLAALGMPIAPFVFEWAYIDWRIPFYSTPLERVALRVAYLERIDLAGRYAQIAEPNFYMRVLYGRYLRFKAQLATAAGLAS